MSFAITSSSFKHEQPIPATHTCQGKGDSPALSWSHHPHGTKSFVLICDDPDATNAPSDGTWVHWVLYNIPASTTQLPEGVASLPGNTKSGINSWGKENYGGPCPPSGKHRYYFKLYALGSTLDFAEAPDKAMLEKAMKDHILAKAELMGTYIKS